MQHLCEEIGDIIEETGEASLADLSRNFSLPINFLVKVCLLNNPFVEWYLIFSCR